MKSRAYFHRKGFDIHFQCYYKHAPLLRFMEATQGALGITPTESIFSLSLPIEDTSGWYRNAYHSCFSAW